MRGIAEYFDQCIWYNKQENAIIAIFQGSGANIDEEDHAVMETYPHYIKMDDKFTGKLESWDVDMDGVEINGEYIEDMAIQHLHSRNMNLTSRNSLVKAMNILFDDDTLLKPSKEVIRKATKGWKLIAK